MICSNGGPAPLSDFDYSEKGTRHHVCLRCGSTSVEEPLSLWVVFGLICIWPFFPVRRRYACGECGHCWKQFRW